jgi:uncharacterized membrane protein
MVATTTPIHRQVTSGQLRRGSAEHGVNVGDAERLLSLFGGSALALYGLARRDLPGLGLAAVGGGILYRGLSGHCNLYDALGINTAKSRGHAASVAAGRGVRVVRAVTIDRPTDELYRVWHDFENLPHFMSHLKSVKTEGNRSHWVAKAPAGLSAEWDAEIVNDRPGRLIAWRSLEGSEVATAGSVHFTSAPGGRGTEVLVELKYDPPGGKAGSWLARLFGEEPSLQIQDDLQRFKVMMEGGQTAAAWPQASASYK